jgi:hypothetical protein
MFRKYTKCFYTFASKKKTITIFFEIGGLKSLGLKSPLACQGLHPRRL